MLGGADGLSDTTKLVTARLDKIRKQSDEGKSNVLYLDWVNSNMLKKPNGICCLNTEKLFATIWKSSETTQLNVQLQGSKLKHVQGSSLTKGPLEIN